jgi:adenine-specific DNA-methyltransferase
MKNTTRTPEDNEKAQLENEVARLNKKIAKYEAVELKQNRFGLVWLDVPEAFEDDVENKLPILEEVPKLAINSKDGKPTHLLIEGDNYHALTCLNYTHKGKVDVIYIDPPYNTGSDGFKYKDRRFLKEFPDGTPVEVDHPLRHSYWLSFMKKRLEISRDILKSTGIIFISIDDNECAQLKLLCDEIFNEKNFVAQLVWKKKYTGGKHARHYVDMHEYILVYAKNRSEIGDVMMNRPDEEMGKFTEIDKYLKTRGKYYIRPLKSNLAERKTLVYPIQTPDGKETTTQWLVGKDTFQDLLKDERIEFRKKRNGEYQIYKKYYENDNGGMVKVPSLILEFPNTEAKAELKDIFNIEEGRDNIFYTVKPVNLIKYLLRPFALPNAIILDFFAGSGTTGQSVLELNKKDDGNRQFILVTNNDEITNGKKHKIMTDICYPRIKKITNGYNGNKGLGNSVKYFRTAFVGKNNILKADDADKIELAHNAGGMLAIAENTFDQVEQNDYWQIFGNEKQYTAVYFREEYGKFDDFIERVRKLKKPAVVYIFSWEKEFEFNEFEDDKNIKVKTIPQPILEIYKQIYNLV